MEEKIDSAELKNAGGQLKRLHEKAQPCVLSQVAVREENKLRTGIEELDRVLGGGIVQGSLTLVGGDPGIGKSTILLQIVPLPAPLGPTTKTNSPGSIRTLTSFKATAPLGKTLLTSDITSTTLNLPSFIIYLLSKPKANCVFSNAF